MIDKISDANILNNAQSNCIVLNPECIICRTKESKLIFKKEGFNYFLCSRCGLVYIFPRPLQKELIGVYEDLGKQYFSSKDKIKEDFSYKYIAILDFLEISRLTNRLLEIGCSTGSFLSAARERGWIPFGTEISRHSAMYGITQHQLNIFIGEFLDAHFPSEYFDAVLLIQTLEHLPEPDVYIKECYRVLRKNGTIFISVPNFKGITTTLLKSRYFYVQDQHLFYFSPKSLQTLLEKMSFRIISSKTEGVDLFNLILGSIFRSTQKSEIQTKIMKTNLALKKNRFVYFFRFLYKLFTFPIRYFGRGDGILLYARKS
jgi:SAM-dependent methyltransferase